MVDDDYADTLAAAAAQLTVRVREDPPAVNDQWLTGLWRDWYRIRPVTAATWYRDLAVMCAIAVPLDRTWRELTGWARRPVDSLVRERFFTPIPRPADDPVEIERRRRVLTDALTTRSRPHAVDEVVDREGTAA